MSTIAPVSIPTGTWEVDTLHSSVEFAVKHFGVSTFRGSFPALSGSVTTAEGRLQAVEGVVEIGSLATGDGTLDGHLRSEDFFAVDAFPRATFRSTQIAESAGGGIELGGLLTIRDATLPVTFTGSLEGIGPDPYGNQRAGFAFTGVIDRTAFGVDWNADLEGGGFVVAPEVALSLRVEAVLPGEQS